MDTRKHYRMSTREMLIRELQAAYQADRPILERALPNMFASTRRAEVVKELEKLLSDGYLIRIGTGKRGYPRRIVLSGTWPFNKCPLCGHVKFFPEEQVSREHS